MKFFTPFRKKSPWVLHYNAGSCNGCDIEILAALSPKYDLERFGVINTGNPKQSDVFLVTGPVTYRSRERLVERSRRLRREAADQSAVLDPLFNTVDSVRDGAAWVRAHPQVLAAAVIGFALVVIRLIQNIGKAVRSLREPARNEKEGA